jgi:ribosomal protein S18 acetylase RimI-like enzyme
MTVDVRLANLSDLDAVCRLAHDVSVLHAAMRPDVFAVPVDAAQRTARWRQDLEQPDRASFVALRAGVAVGFISGKVADEPSDYFLPTRLCHVNSIGVVESERGRGIGRALMAALEAWGRRRGANEVHLTVWRFNERARALYAELGYEERTLLMCKRIA